MDRLVPFFDKDQAKKYATQRAIEIKESIRVQEERINNFLQISGEYIY